MLYPQRLQKGDTVGIIAPASPSNSELLKQGQYFLEEIGLRVKFGKNLGRSYGYLGGTDEERLNDFHDMMMDEEVKAIFFSRGGYGTGRFVPFIDYSMVAENPKIIWGYSDITYLHTAIRQRTNLITFHGPMIESDLTKKELDPLTKEMFQQLFRPTTLTYSEEISPLDVLVSGQATGKLVGGNLSLLISTLGTPYEIDVVNKILLIEDVNEEPYKVDSMLNQLTYANKLNEAGGIVVGDFAKAEPTREPSLELTEVFKHYFGNLSCPVMTGFKIGHCLPHFAVPLGVNVTLNTEEKRLVIEPGVTI